MRTKTLLLAAAALLAGLVSTSTQAQNVYSANVVGYYNLTVPGSKFVMLSDQLPPDGTNSSINAVLTNGVADGSLLFLWNGTGYDVVQYYAGFGWYDQSFNFVTNSLPPHKGAFFQNGSASPSTLTLVGQVPQGSKTNAIAAGFGVYSLPAPLSTNLDSTLGNFPSSDGDLFFQWNASSQQFDSVKQYYAGFGWYDQSFTQVYPTPKVGEGFFYQHAGSSSNWVFNFNVQ